MSIEGSHEPQPKPTNRSEIETVPPEVRKEVFDSLSAVLRAHGESHELPGIPGVDHTPQAFHLPLDRDVVATVFVDDLASGHVESADATFTEAYSDPELAINGEVIPPELKVVIHSKALLPDVGDGRGMELNRHAHYLFTQTESEYPEASTFVEYTITTPEGEVELPVDLDHFLLEILRHSEEEWAAMADHTPEETDQILTAFTEQGVHDLTPEEASRLAAIVKTLTP